MNSKTSCFLTGENLKKAMTSMFEYIASATSDSVYKNLLYSLDDSLIDMSESEIVQTFATAYSNADALAFVNENLEPLHSFDVSERTELYSCIKELSVVPDSSYHPLLVNEPACCIGCGMNDTSCATGEYLFISGKRTYITASGKIFVTQESWYYCGQNEIPDFVLRKKARPKYQNANLLELFVPEKYREIW
mgnify:CR=1 FL=1